MAHHWYVVHTKPRKETVALDQLRGQGFTGYLPMMKVARARRGKVATVIEPLFNRYCFVQLDLDSDPWGTIRSTRGVSALVRFGTEPTAVPQQLIEALRSREAALPVAPLFQPGTAVRVTQGPLQGLEGIYHCPDGAERALVLLEMLGKMQRIKLDLVQLRPAV